MKTHRLSPQFLFTIGLVAALGIVLAPIAPLLAQAAPPPAGSSTLTAMTNADGLVLQINAYITTNAPYYKSLQQTNGTLAAQVVALNQTNAFLQAQAGTNQATISNLQFTVASQQTNLNGQQALATQLQADASNALYNLTNLASH